MMTTHFGTYIKLSWHSTGLIANIYCFFFSNVLVFLFLQHDVPENPAFDAQLNRTEPWRVSASWATDLSQYNEWMNEEDYEVDANGKKKVINWQL